MTALSEKVPAANLYESRLPLQSPVPDASFLSGWQIACRSRELRGKPVKAVIGGRAIVLFRGADGAPAALEDRCAHRNAPLSLGRVCAGRLQCAYHGWEYDGCGRVASVPAFAAGVPAPDIRIRSYRACEQDGFVWLACGETQPALPAPRFPHLGEHGWTSFVMRTRFAATVEACLENFLDCPHATFVHRYWFRAPTAKPVRATVRTLDDGAIAEFLEEPREKSLVWSLLAPRGGPMHHTDRFIAPHTSQVEYRFPSGLHYVITSSCTQVGPAETQVFTVISFRAGIWGPLVRLYFEPMSRYIIRQDVDILAAQQRNVAGFAGPCFASTPADLLGPHIVAWRRALKAGAPPPSAGSALQMEMRL